MCQCYLREYVVKIHPSQLSVGVEFSLHWKYLWTPQSSRVGLRRYLLLGPATNILDQSFCPHFLHIRYQLVFVFVQYDQFIFFNYILYIITYLLTILDFVFVQYDQFVFYFQLIFSPSPRAPHQKTRLRGDSAQIWSRKLIRTRCRPKKTFFYNTSVKFETLECTKPLPPLTNIRL